MSIESQINAISKPEAATVSRQLENQAKICLVHGLGRSITNDECLLEIVYTQPYQILF